jgi:hypothetical protein
LFKQKQPLYALIYSIFFNDLKAHTIVGAGIFAEGDTVVELKKSIKSGIKCYFENTEDAPNLIMSF